MLDLRRIWLLAIVMIVSLLGACDEAAVAPKAPTAAVAKGPETASEEDVAVPISADDPVRGSRYALVTIVTFTDFQCPYCGRLAATLDRVRETYGDEVRIVMKNDPLSFHPQAKLAAQVGAAVYQLNGADAFWRYHDMAFRRQEMMAPQTIRAWAISAGADAAVLEKGLEQGTWVPKVKRDQELAQRLGVTGTPMSYVNGVEVPGAQPFEKWRDVIDTLIVDARGFAAEGVPRDQIYARTVKKGFEEPKPLGGRDDDEDEKPDTATWRVPVAGSPVRGKADALVTIVEFSDFQCPFCRKVEPVMKRVLTEYGDRVRIVWKDLPLSFHDRALPAAEAARSARAQKGDAGFWAMHDRLLDTESLDDRDLEAAAKAAGIDAAKVIAAVNGKTYAKGIDADTLLADDVAAQGTPHFFVNGKRLVGAQGFDKFKSTIDAELQRAEERVKSGTLRVSVYDAIIKDGLHAPDPERRTVAPPAVSAPFRGAANGAVVIQEFSDFQCPFCGRAEPTMDALIAAYPTQVKIVWRNLPLTGHDDAPLAAEAAREAFVQKGNDGFSKMRVLLFQHQREPEGLKRIALEGYAAQIGLDPAKFASALDNHTHRGVIDADAKAANDANISGTPSFVVGPYGVAGAQALPKFKRLVERVLSESAGK